MHRTRVAVLTVIVAVVLTGFAAAISAASGPSSRPAACCRACSQPPQVRESLRSSALVRSRAVTGQSFPAIGAGHVRVVIESDSSALGPEGDRGSRRHRRAKLAKSRPG